MPEIFHNIETGLLPVLRKTLGVSSRLVQKSVGELMEQGMQSQFLALVDL